jgi:hypothetical protein
MVLRMTCESRKGTSSTILYKHKELEVIQWPWFVLDEFAAHFETRGTTTKQQRDNRTTFDRNEALRRDINLPSIPSTTSPIARPLYPYPKNSKFFCLPIASARRKNSRVRLKRGSSILEVLALVLRRRLRRRTVVNSCD